MKLFLLASNHLVVLFVLLCTATTGVVAKTTMDDGSWYMSQEETSSPARHDASTSFLFRRDLFLKNHHDDDGNNNDDGRVLVGGVYNTGVDSTSGTALMGGAQADLNYKVVENSNLPAQTLSFVDGNYVPDDSSSRWIWQRSDGFPIGIVRTFETTLNLTGYDPASAVLTGSWATDDIGMDILLNGASTGNNATNFNQLFDFTIDSGFQSGVNVLQFKVEDLRIKGGIRVANMTLKARPEKGAS